MVAINFNGTTASSARLALTVSGLLLTLWPTTRHRHVYQRDHHPIQRHRYVPAARRPFGLASMTARFLATLQARSGARVLDVACGTGIVARRMAGVVGPSGSVTG